MAKGRLSEAIADSPEKRAATVRLTREGFAVSQLLRRCEARSHRRAADAGAHGRLPPARGHHRQGPRRGAEALRRSRYRLLPVLSPRRVRHQPGAARPRRRAARRGDARGDRPGARPRRQPGRGVTRDPAPDYQELSVTTLPPSSRTLSPNTTLFR